MAIFNITNNKNGALPYNAVPISTLPVSYCPPQTTSPIDTYAYHDGGQDGFVVGVTLYSDEALTTLYNQTGANATYNTNKDPLGYIELTFESVYRAPVCYEPVPLGYAVSDETSDLTSGVAKVTFRIPYAMTLTDVRASLTTAPTGSSLVVDINNEGASILSTKLSIDANEKTSTTATTPPVISNPNLSNDTEITVDIDQVGVITAGTGLKIYLIGSKV